LLLRAGRFGSLNASKAHSARHNDAACAGGCGRSAGNFAVGVGAAPQALGLRASGERENLAGQTASGCANTATAGRCGLRAGFDAGGVGAAPQSLALSARGLRADFADGCAGGVTQAAAAGGRGCRGAERCGAGSAESTPGALLRGAVGLGGLDAGNLAVCRHAACAGGRGGWARRCAGGAWAAEETLARDAILRSGDDALGLVCAGDAVTTTALCGALGLCAGGGQSHDARGDALTAIAEPG
jgi:hypothetical protein